MTLTVLLQLEFKSFWNDFKTSLHNRRYIAAYLIVFTTMIGFYFGSWLLVENRFFLDIFDFLEIDAVAQNMIIVFPVWMIYSMIKGFYPSSVTNLYSPADITLIFPGPTSSREVYLSKYVKSLSRHTGLLFLIFLSISPFFISAKLRVIEVILLFSFVLLFYEVTQLFSHLEFFIISSFIQGEWRAHNERKIVPISIFLLVLGLSLIDVFYLKTGVNIFVYLSILTSSPSQIIRQVFFSSASIQVCGNCILVYLLTFVVLLMITYWNAVDYYGFFSQNDVSVKHRPSIFASSYPVLTYQDSKFGLLFTKDLVMLLRSFGGILLLNIGFVYSLAGIFILYYGEVISSFDEVLVMYGAPFFYIIFNQLKFFPDDIINRDWGSLWFLRSSKLSQSFLVQAKIIFGYSVSMVFTMPFLASLFVVNESDWYFLTVLILNLMLLNTPIRLFASSFISLGSDNFIDSFLSNFIQVLAMFILCALYLQLYFTSTPIVFLYTTVLVSFLITRFGKPIKYYILDLVSNAYFFALMSSVVLGSLILILAIVRTSFLVQNWSIYLRLTWYTVASLLTTLLILRQFIKSTMNYYND